jgi:putative endonuclease
MAGWVYIMANRKFGTTYVGATSDLVWRVWEHKNDLVPSFTRTHRCHLLVYFEEQQDMYWALQRERNLKHWVRAWKDALIEKNNPEWDDLYWQIAPG